MKKELILSIVIIVVIIGGILFSMNPKQNVPSTITPTVAQTAPTENVSISLEDLGKHNMPNDCWVMVNNKVYNVTAYAPNHLGGSNMITDLCGKDATTAFMTKGGKGQHSMKANDMLTRLYVGDIKQ